MAALAASEAGEPTLRSGAKFATTGDVAEESGRAPDGKEEEGETAAAAAATTTTGAAAPVTSDDTAAADDDDDREPPRPPPPRSKPCSSCGADSKYQCPRCGVRSCSAPCVGKHKEVTGCTGKRDRAAFVPVSEMTNATLASDIGLLEEVERAAAAAQRGAALPPALAEAVVKAAKGHHHHHQGGASSSKFRGGGLSYQDPSPSPSQPPHLQQLVAEASRRGVRLRLAPPGFEARRRNGTRYDGKQKKMHWHVEWRFYHSDSSTSTGYVKREDRRIREDALLVPFLRRHLDLEEGKESEEERASPLPSSFLEEATAAAAAAAAASSPSGSSALPFRALLRLDGRPANNPGWLDFSLKDEGITLGELLRGRTVDEFPVVALVAAASPEGSKAAAALPPGEVVAIEQAAPAIAPLPVPPAVSEDKDHAA